MRIEEVYPIAIHIQTSPREIVFIFGFNCSRDHKGRLQHAGHNNRLIRK